MINLITAGISSYNFKQHVASDVGVDQSYLPSININTQGYMDKIERWTNENQMKVNGKKTKLMIINFTRNYQISTRIYLEGELLEIVKETLLLGCVITSDLKFQKNTEHMVKKA